ncbi:MAG: hypothetical protein NTY83_01555 [Candidatus Micrarchaeota archaeon]|nr:hypothetical protein [Candidatus Micrarchaeota archaeon]
MPVDGEANFSDWAFSVIRRDDTINDTMKYLGKFVLNANNMRIGQINWLAKKINFVKQGGKLDEEEFSIVSMMLGSQSVTISGCAKELIENCLSKQPEEARECLMGALSNGSNPAKMAAAEVLARSGDTGAAVRICGMMPEFCAYHRRVIARMVERLVRESEEGADLGCIKKTLKEGASKLQAAGEDAQEEFRRYFLMVKNAAGMAEATEKKKCFVKKDSHEQRKLLRAAC